MTRTEIISYIEKPHLIAEKEVGGLSELADRFPFSQTIQLLYTKGLHNLKSIDYLEKLKLAAALTADRKVLYNFIIQQGLLEKIESVVKEIEEAEDQLSHPEENVQISREENPDEIIEKKVKELIGDKMSRVDHIEEIVDQQVKATMEPLLTDDPEEKKENIEIEEPETVKEKNESLTGKYSEFEKQILWEAVNASIQSETKAELTQPINLPEPEKGGTFNWNTKHSFFNWLVPVKGPDSESKIQGNEQRPDSSKKPVKEDISALVDKFIQADPKITPQKTEFFTPGNVAKISIIDNEAFVSETLAKIYEKQGYYQKAMRIYEKLSLKIPEKSAYFASRLKELETILKTQKNK